MRRAISARRSKAIPHTCSWTFLAASGGSYAPADFTLISFLKLSHNYVMIYMYIHVHYTLFHKIVLYIKVISLYELVFVGGEIAATVFAK